MSKILLITLAWPTKGNSNLYKDLMVEFINHGHDVYVMTTLEKRYGTETVYEEDCEIKIIRVACGNITKTQYIEKTLSLLYLNIIFNKIYKKYFINIDIDLVIQSTPSILLSCFVSKTIKHNKCYFYLLLRDIWPQGAVDHNVIKKYGVIWFFLRYHEIRTYKLANKIGCMSHEAVEFILQNNKFLKQNKVEYCPNTIALRMAPVIDRNIIREKYGIPKDNIVYIYGGNISKSHNINFISKCISDIPKELQVSFVFAGSGTEYDALKNSLKQNGKAVFINNLCQKEYLDLLYCCDVGLILLSEKYTVPQFPSKFLDYISFNKPIFSISNKESNVGFLIENFKCGVNINNNNYLGFHNAVRKLTNIQTIEEMGKNSNLLFVQHFTVNQTYYIIMKSFNFMNYEV